MSQDEAFAAFVAEAGPRLLRGAYLLTGDRLLAEDALQDALARAFLRWSRIDSPEAYVRRALVNGQRSAWRRRRVAERLTPVTPEAGAQSDHADDSVRVDAVARALQALTARERSVLVLRYWHDLSEAAVADELGIALGTVKSTAHRALGKLRLSPHLATAPNGEPS